LSCSGIVVDQPARLAIASLGDHRVNNNVVSGFFTVSLLRASDGALLTNATGSDIIVNCVTLPDATAKEEKTLSLPTCMTYVSVETVTIAPPM